MDEIRFCHLWNREKVTKKFFVEFQGGTVNHFCHQTLNVVLQAAANPLENCRKSICPSIRSMALDCGV
ncbi:hypothetical protein JTE90_003004 [Oedothorax gibbosus]|uniref:Uncharacterized protein n=1 Tax=Oedothorax gibbosus TaxID=931172 RepID=A0AAV6VBB5_9ARAC|nr:hypothetical protein JTE90_003004 [Oedothorax gibbosus]